jgi:hypothetical protein
MSAAVLRVRQCRACKAIFYVCSSCDRGNATVAKSAEPKPGSSSYVRLTAVTRRPRKVDRLTCVASDSIGFAELRLRSRLA